MRQLSSCAWPVIAAAIGAHPVDAGGAGGDRLRGGLGPCTIRWIGAERRLGDGGQLAGGGHAAAACPIGTDTVCIDDGNPLTSLVVTRRAGKTVAGIDNAEELRIAASSRSARVARSSTAVLGVCHVELV